MVCMQNSRVNHKCIIEKKKPIHLKYAFWISLIELKRQKMNMLQVRNANYEKRYVLVIAEESKAICQIEHGYLSMFGGVPT